MNLCRSFSGIGIDRNMSDVRLTGILSFIWRRSIFQKMRRRDKCVFRERWTFCQMSKSDSPNTFVISSSAVNVLIDLRMVVNGMMTMIMMVVMMRMLDLTYVSIWVSPMLVLKRFSWSFAWETTLSQWRQEIFNISIWKKISHLHNRKFFGWLHHSNVPLIQLPESDDNVKHCKRWISKINFRE